MNHSTALVTVIYPGCLPFLQELILSVNHQTDRQFSFVLVNDGVENTALLEGLIRVPYQLISGEGSPLQIRLAALSLLRQQGYRYALFADADDVLPRDWVARMKEPLQLYPFVCCDLALIDSSGMLLHAHYWQERLGSTFEFDQPFLLDKNILGFGNCGLQLSDALMLEMPDRPPPAPDWYFFFTNLAGKKALFTAETKIFYRQHGGNQLGLPPLNRERLLQIVERKTLHYQLLAEQGYSTAQQHSDLKSLREALLQPSPALEEKIKVLIQQEIHYFWWEEPNYLL